MRKFYKMAEIKNIIERLMLYEDPLCKGDPEADRIITRLKDVFTNEKIQNWQKICLLSCTLKVCDNDLFEENTLNWFRNCLKVVTSVPSESLLQICYEILIRIFERARNIDKISRELSTRGIDPLITILLKNSLPITPKTFELLNVCLKLNGGACRNHLKEIEQFVLFVSVNERQCIARYAIDTFPYLSLAGSSGENHSKHVGNWSNLLNKTIRTIYVNLTELLNSESKFKPHENVLPFPTNDFLIDGLSKDLQLLHIERAFSLLSALFSNEMPFQVDIPLTVCIYILKENSSLLNIDLKEHNIYCKRDVKVAIAKVVSSFLDCLNCFIMQYATLLIPFTKVLTQIILESLSSPYNADRILSYTGVCHLVKYLYISPVNNNFITDFVEIMLKDVDGQYSSITNNISTESDAKGKLKKKNQAVYIKGINTLNDKDYHASMWSFSLKNATSALNSLHEMIVYIGPLLDVSLVQTICLCMSKSLQNLYGNDGRITGAFESSENRLLLFKVLHSLFTLYNSKIKIPKNVLLSFFQNGTTDVCGNVAEYCKKKIYIFDQIVHSSSPELRVNATVFKKMDETMDAEDFPTQLKNIGAPRILEIVDSASLGLPTCNTDLPSYPAPSIVSEKHAESLDNASVNIQPIAGSSSNSATCPVKTHPENGELPHQTMVNERNEQSQIVLVPTSFESQVSVARTDEGQSNNTTIYSADKNDVVVVNSSDEEGEVSAASTKHKRQVSNSPTDIDFSMDIASKKLHLDVPEASHPITNGNSSQEQEFQDIISTFCEVTATR